VLKNQGCPSRSRAVLGATIGFVISRLNNLRTWLTRTFEMRVHIGHIDEYAHRRDFVSLELCMRRSLLPCPIMMRWPSSVICACIPLSVTCRIYSTNREARESHSSAVGMSR
jgi:hypothetical protein